MDRFQKFVRAMALSLAPWCSELAATQSEKMLLVRDPITTQMADLNTTFLSTTLPPLRLQARRTS